ncbi:MAG TPA: single-stranded-DNA-specific exonuclease RecJ, partial [Candidatus Merdenecus merdavium]|nr:single-stranded-DNA-specific exonuclease RecJ [Candidatus Merdenecus merdavium]
MEKWFVAAKKADFNKISNRFHISPVTARIIRNRDIIEMEDIENYLHGDMSHLHSGRSMYHMEKGLEIIKNKIKEKKKIQILGDYDIDGVNATHILYTGIKRCGGIVSTAIPNRMKDGYGINEHLIQEAFDHHIDTIITCDNGIAAIDAIKFGKDLGMTIIVTDHHDIPYEEVINGNEITRKILRSTADAIINPKQEECQYPFKHLCGAGVAYKFIECLYEDMNIDKEELFPLIEFAAIATVGDVMDLVGENRIIVKEGLKRIKQTRNLGIKALMEVNHIDQERLSSYHIGFVMGPCINASGRLDTAKLALQLLQAKTKEEASTIAMDLKALNDSRKAMTLEGTETAIQKIETSPLKHDKVLVVYLPTCHESLAGIIAGRIKERYHKPTFVLTDAEEGAKGSGRSIESYNMFEELVKCRDLFTKFGGHPMAAGLSLPIDKIGEMRERLNGLTNLSKDDFIPKVSIDVPMPIQYVSESFIQELELLEPFGKGNPKPVFAEKDLNIINARILGKNKNVLKFQVLNQAGTMIEAMYFG